MNLYTKLVKNDVLQEYKELTAIPHKIKMLEIDLKSNWIDFLRKLSPKMEYYISKWFRPEDFDFFFHIYNIREDIPELRKRIITMEYRIKEYEHSNGIGEEQYSYCYANIEACQKLIELQS